MSSRINRKCVLLNRPEGLPQVSDFGVVEEAAMDPAPGCVTVAVEHLSIDPFIRAALNEGSAHSPVPIGGTLPALGVGRVIASATPDFAEGDPVHGTLLAQTVATLPVAMVQNADVSRVPLTAYLGVLGMTGGLTAYFGMRDVAAPKRGETVVVSAAAGAVGSIAGQIARIDGARVIGIAGGPKKVHYVVDELGFDACIDYKGEDLGARLGVSISSTHTPSGSGKKSAQRGSIGMSGPMSSCTGGGCSTPSRLSSSQLACMSATMKATR